jgi:hypothetical protein
MHFGEELLGRPLYGGNGVTDSVKCHRVCLFQPTPLDPCEVESVYQLGANK